MNKKQQLIMKMMDESKKGFDKYKKEFAILENGFLNVLSDELTAKLEERGKSALTPKIVKAKIRRIVIGILKTYFENDRFAQLKSIFDDESEDVPKLQEALDHWIDKRINLYSRIKPMMYDACIYGLCCAKIYWVNKTMKINRVKIRDIFLDPNAESVFDLQYVVHRTFSTVGKLTRQFGKKKLIEQNAGNTSDSFGGVSKISTEFIGDATRVLVHDVYRLQDGKWYVSTIIGENTFLRTDEPLKDGLPFVFGIIDPQFTTIAEKNIVEAYGSSLVEPMIPLQDEYTVLRNQQIDATNEQLNVKFMATKMAGLNYKDILSNKKVITANDLNQVRELPQPNINQSIFNADRLDTEMQEVSGVTKFNQGMHDKSLNQTATGMSILTQEGNEVIADIIRSLNESFFEPLIARMVKLIYKYDENPLLYGVDRKKSIRFKVFIDAGAGATNKEVKLNNITTAEQTALQIVNVSAQLGDIEKAKKYLEVLDELYAQKLATIGLRNVAKTLKEDTDGRDRDADTDDATSGAFGAFGGAGETQDQQGLEMVYGGDDGQVQQPLQ